MISVNLGVWFIGMQRSMVKLSQTTRKCKVIMLLCHYHLVLFFMNKNLKSRAKWILKFLWFFFERDTKGTNNTVDPGHCLTSSTPRPMYTSTAPTCRNK